MIRLIILILLFFVVGATHAQTWNNGKAPQSFGNNSPQIPVLAKWRFNADSGLYSFGRPVLKDVDTLRTGFISSKHYADSLYLAMLGYSAPMSHTHTISQVTGLQSALDGKVAYPDTVAMLANYLRSNDTTGKWIPHGWLGSLLKYPDTSGMLANYLLHLNNVSNPHSVTKAQVGLSNADNTSDANKPISTATQAALDAKLNIADTANKWIGIGWLSSLVKYPDTSNLVAPYLRKSDTTGMLANYLAHLNNSSNPHNVTKGQVGLGNVPNVDATDASNISTGTLSDGRLSGNVTLQGNSFNGVSQLVKTGADGKLVAGVIPALALVETQVFSDQASMLAWSAAEMGDVAVRTDINTSFILQQAPASTLSNWVQLLTPDNEQDPIFTASAAYGITNTHITNWDAAFYWGDHSAAGYLLSSTAATTYEPLFSKNTAFNKNFGTAAGTVAEGNDSRINNGQTAYSWGNHAGAGYLTSFTETDPLSLHTSGGTVTGHIIGSYGANPLSISSYSSGNFEARVTDAEYLAGARAGYGFHNINVQGLYLYADADEKLRLRVPSGINVLASEGWVTSQGYLTSFTEADPVYSVSDAANVTATLIGQWNTAFANSHTHANKALLDTYTQTEADLADAVAKKHAHANLAILDAITASYSTAEQTKLSGIAAGAEVNVNADWNAVSGDAQILNKPTALSAFTNDLGFITGYTETDPHSIPLTGSNNISGSLIGVDNSHDIGSSAIPWKNIYADQVFLNGDLAATQIWVNGQGFQPDLGTSTGGKYLYQDQTWKQIAYSEISGTPSIPTSLPPSGTAGGDLSGTYPNPTVAQFNGQLPAYYLNRGNHTGGQAISTVTGLQSALDGKVAYGDTAAMLTNYLTSEVDGSVTNELQTIGKVGSTVTLSNSGGSFTDDNTTYSNGYGLNLSSTTFGVDTTVIASKTWVSNIYQPLIPTGSTAQYFRGDFSLATFPTALSSFTNDLGFITGFTEADPLSILNGTTPQTASYNITGTGTVGTLSVTGNGSILGTDIYVPNIPNGSGNFVMLNSGYLHQRTPTQIIADLGLNSLYLQLGGGTMNTGANIHMVSSDPSNGVIKFTSSLATSPHTWYLGTGLYNSHYQGLELYDATVDAVRLYLSDAGDFTMFNSLTVGTNITTTAGYIGAGSYVAATTQVYSSIGVFSNSSNGDYLYITGNTAQFLKMPGTTMNVYTGGLLASNTYSDAAYIPTNGIFSRGAIATGTVTNAVGDFITWDFSTGLLNRRTAAQVLSDIGAYSASNPNGYTTNTGTVTSIGISVPTGLSVSNTPIVSSGTIAIGLQSGYSIPTNASQSAWNAKVDQSGLSANVIPKWNGSALVPSSITDDGANTIFGNRASFTDAVYYSGASAYTSGSYQLLVRTTSSNRVELLPATTFLTGNQTISLTGPITGSGATTIATTIGNNVIAHGNYQQVAGLSFIANPSGSTGNVSAVGVGAARGMLELDNSHHGPSYSPAGNVANVIAIGNVKFVRNGDKVICYGVAEVEFSGSGAATWTMDLPIYSDFADVVDAMGFGNGDNDHGTNLRISANPSDDELRFDCNGTAGEKTTFNWSVMYDIF